MRLLTRVRTPSSARTGSLPAGLRRGVILPGVLAVALAGGLSACSGDEDDSDGGSGDESSASADQASDEESQGPGAQIGDCRVEVEVTGDAEASWTGKANVRTPGADDTGGGPSATYVAEKGKNQLSIYSAGEDFAGPAVTFTSGKQTYASDPADQDAMTVEEDGSGAEVDLGLRGLGDRSADLTATYTCGDDVAKQGGDKKGKKTKKGNENKG